jgi:hypothetical protein
VERSKFCRLHRVTRRQWSGPRMVAAKVVAVVPAIAALVSFTTGAAFGVVGGRTVSITAAPWTVVVREYGQQRCTGVIIDPSRILTAGHCVMSNGGNSAKPLPPSDFAIEAGVSNFKHPLKSDHPQLRSISAVHPMPGYIAGSKITHSNYLAAVTRDLAVLTLSHPLDLAGGDARAAHLPTSGTHEPRNVAGLVMAGFGDERPTGYYENGTLNEVVSSAVRGRCSTGQVLCIFQRTSTCSGDSGSGAVEAAHARPSSESSAKASRSANLAWTITRFLPRHQRCASSRPAGRHARRLVGSGDR